MEKKINYTSRTYESIKNELIEFSNQYYPDIATNFNDNSVGAWFIDLCASVGDSLNYAIDRNFQECNVNSSTLRSSALNNARANGVRVPGRKASICEVEFSCELPVANATNKNIGQPNWEYAPKIKRGTIVSSGSYSYELQEDVDFKEQFNSNAYSNRTFTPIRNSNNLVTSYKVTKSAIVMSGNSKVYKKVINSGEIQPFMEIVLPDKDVMNVESIIFKESSNFNVSPNVSDYFRDAEIYKCGNETISTYRFFEVDSLADQYKFLDEVSELDGKIMANVYSTYDENGTEVESIYKGKWKTIRQKFITEYTDNGYMKVIFGASNNYNEIPTNQTSYADYVMSNMLNNDMLGLIPKANWTMFVLYRIGGGTETNVASGAINNISFLNAEYPKGSNLDKGIVQQVMNSFLVTNTSVSLGGKNAPSTEEIKYLTKYNVNSQQRCVTVKDYKGRMMMMPPKYGCPFRTNVIEENNKVVISMLGLNYDGKLTDELNSVMVDNMKEYLSNYKNLTDYVEMRSGMIYNLIFEVSIFLDKTYDTNELAKTVINTIYDYMDVNKHDMGEDIFIGDLQKEITNLDGVISIIDMVVYNPNGANYGDECPLPTLKIYDVENCDGQELLGGGNGKAIDLGALDGVLKANYNSMYEIKYKDKDIKLKIKTR